MRGLRSGLNRSPVPQIYGAFFLSAADIALFLNEACRGVGRCLLSVALCISRARSAIIGVFLVLLILLSQFVYMPDGRLMVAIRQFSPG